MSATQKAEGSPLKEAEDPMKVDLETFAQVMEQVYPDQSRDVVQRIQIARLTEALGKSS